MTPNFMCLIIIWFLLLKSNAAVTTGLYPNHNNVTATLDTSDPTTQQASTLEGPTWSSDSVITSSTVADVKPQVETQTVTTEKMQMSTQTTGTPMEETSDDLNLSTLTTEVVLTAFPTTDSSKSTQISTGPTDASSQSQSAENVPTSPISEANISTSSSSSPAQPTLMTTATASVKPVDKSTSGDVTRSLTTTLKLTVLTTEASQGNNSKTKDNHSKIAAGLIGGALLLMMVGFLIIYIRKRRAHEKQKLTTDWAGPSPFLSGTDDSEVMLRSSNRISLSSFLPQRLSKRLSQLPEVEAELQDMTQNSTFEGKCHQNPLCDEAKEKDAQKQNGTPVVTQEKDSPENNNIAPTNSSETPNHTPDESGKSTETSGEDEKSQEKKEEEL